MKIYEDKNFLYEMYVKKRMNLTDICKILDSKYNIKITPQALYNHVKKHDLLKYRGKGRNLNANLRQKKSASMGQNPAKMRQEKLKQRARQNRAKGR